MADDTPASWMDSLHAFPEIAQNLGQFVAAFATLERMIWCLYGKAIGSDQQGAIAMLGHIESFAIKLTAVESFLTHSPHITVDERLAFFGFLQDARESNTFRNTLAHGIYLSDEGGTKVELLAYATSTGRKPKQIPLTAALLEAETNKVLDLRRAMRDLIFPDFAGSHGPKHVRQ